MTYLKGKDNVIADALNLVSPLEPKPEDADNFGVIPVHHITSEINTTGSQLEAISVAKQADSVLNQPKHQIFQGWPDSRRCIPESIYQLWNYQGEISVEDWVVFKTKKVMIPMAHQQKL